MTAHARLYTLAEVEETRTSVPLCELDARFWHGLQGAIMWSAMPSVRCAFCNAELEGHATYLIVLLPGDPEAGFGSSGACCVTCGQKLPREQLQVLAEQAAMCMFDEVRGRA